MQMMYYPYRSNGDSWSELKSSFIEILDFVQKHFPWIRFVHTRDAYNILDEYDDMGAEYIWNDDEKILEINCTPGLLLRVRQNDKKILEIEGAEIIYQYEHISSIIIETTSTAVRIEFGQEIEE